jgi:hypothetical protein
MKVRGQWVVWCALLLVQACGGKSNASGEVVPIDRVCNYEKWKTVAVEGYLAPLSMVCEKASKKKTSGVAWCFFKVYSDANLTGPIFQCRFPPRIL